MPTQGVNVGVLKSQGKMNPGNLIRIVEDNIVEDSGIITSGPGGGGVTSFNTRTGAVIPVNGDYSVSQVTGAAPLASPTFTGTVTLPSGLVVPAAGVNLAPDSGQLVEVKLPDHTQLLLLAPDAFGSGDSVFTLGDSGAFLRAGSVVLELDGGGSGIHMSRVIELQGISQLYGNGIPGIAAGDQATGLGANYNGGASKLLLTNRPVGTLLRISGVQQITRIGTTSSTFPSLTVNYTGVGGIARTVQLVPTATTNTTATLTSFNALIFVDNSDVTMISAGYASSGATSMQYALAYVVEEFI